MSKTKELFIIGATAASCAIGYAFYKNNENNQDKQEEKMKQSLIESTSSAMDMSGQDFKRTDDVMLDGTRMVAPKTDDVGRGQGTDSLHHKLKN